MDNPKQIKDSSYKDGEKLFLIYVDSVEGENIKIKLPISFIKIILDAAKYKDGINFNGLHIDTEMVKVAVYREKSGIIFNGKSDKGDKVRIEITE